MKISQTPDNKFGTLFIFNGLQKNKRFEISSLEFLSVKVKTRGELNMVVK